MKKKIFITGGAGLLGSNLAILLKEKYDVLISTHNQSSKIKKIVSEKVNLVSSSEIYNFFFKHKPDIVIHTAGLTNVNLCEEIPLQAKVQNVNIAKNIANASIEHGAKLIHISSDHLFSGLQKLANEGESFSPLNEYARSKCKAEEEVLKINSKCLIIRTNFYGWGPSHRRSFSDEIIYSLEKNIEVNLYNDIFYTPILINSLGEAMIDLAELNHSGIFNIVGSERVSKLEFGQRLAKVFNLDESLIHESSYFNNELVLEKPRDMSLSNNKIEMILDRKIPTLDSDLDRLYQLRHTDLCQEILSQ
jgi:dTDP-4-dehydrorhamnose reductase